MIHFQQTSYIRDNNRVILNDINWQVKKNQHWGILGLNGAGKTTLLQLINGYIWPSTGKLTVLGEVFGETALPILRQKIGWVSSALSYQMKNHFLAEEIVLSGKFATIGLHQTTTAAERASAKKVLTEIGGPELVGKTYGVLSQGERQLTLIARALLAEPELLILDEPCSGLDLFAREKLLTRIQWLIKKEKIPTLLFVTHHLDELLPCLTHLLLLKNGTVFAQGPSEKLLTGPTLTAFYDQAVTLFPLSNQRTMVLPTSER